MGRMGGTNYDDFKRQILHDPNIRKEYQCLIPKYELIRMLIKRRNDLRLSQSKVAQMVGTQQPAIARLESGNCNTRIDTLYKVINALGLDISFKVRESTKQSVC